MQIAQAPASSLSCSLMLRVNRLILTHFKNYAFSAFDFTEKVVGICGLNGRGKTNLLDALYYLCFTRSYFSRTEQLNVRFGAEGLRLEGHLSLDAFAGQQDSTYKVVCINRGNTKKEVAVNEELYDRFSRHIGRFTCVMIAPDDVALITGGSEERRKYIDTTLSQLDADYLQQLITYTRVLQQRNSLLKRFAESGQADLPLLDVLDQQLLIPGIRIWEKRQSFTRLLIDRAIAGYAHIAGNVEAINISYESQLNHTPFSQLLLEGREKDRLLQRTQSGIHKDDLALLLDGQPFKSIASQGQRKSLLFALKLAEYELLQQEKGFAPLLLLDDVFEKLDDTRMQNLLHQVCIKGDGQVFITDTHPERLEAQLQALRTPYQLVRL
jgi:DNA replication and repair protein RecF